MTNAVEKIEPIHDEPRAVTPLAILERAVASGADIATLERLTALYERFEARSAERAFDEAMSAAQAEMRPIAADLNNTQTKSRYASYHALDNAIRPIYTRHGFSVTYDTADGAPVEWVRVVIKIAHTGGHRATHHFDVPADGKGAKGGDVMTKTHAAVSAVSYGKRTLLGMGFNLAVDRDDDGNAAGGGNGESLKQIDATQFRYIQDLMEQAGVDEAGALHFLKMPPDAKIEEITQKPFKELEAGLRRRIEAAKKKGVTDAR